MRQPHDRRDDGKFIEGVQTRGLVRIPLGHHDLIERGVTFCIKAMILLTLSFVFIVSTKADISVLNASSPEAPLLVGSISRMDCSNSESGLSNRLRSFFLQGLGHAAQRDIDVLIAQDNGRSLFLAFLNGDNEFVSRFESFLAQFAVHAANALAHRRSSQIVQKGRSAALGRLGLSHRCRFGSGHCTRNPLLLEVFYPQETS